jgi:transposase InsO family protein
MPKRLTATEVLAIKEMVESPEYRHVPTGRLAILAQRLGRVFAAPTTWYRLVRERGWRRPRARVHPAKPKHGVRASEPDELWHVDTTVIRLINGTKVYLHAVIDNFSRKILAWRVTEYFEVATTVAILHDAAQGALIGRIVQQADPTRFFC